MNQISDQRLKSIANTIRGLSMDAIEEAGCGHPGLPLGCADILSVLFAEFLRFNPQNPEWVNRDRFVLSAGHGSMGLYAALHIAGFDVTLDDIRQFRKMGSKTAGHPEYGECPGVETTTGPLGQGFATTVGMALGHKMLASQLDLDQHSLMDAAFVVLTGDGCMMEGVSSEASSLAGHLSLDNLIVIYDSNDICLDGPTSECFTEDVAARYRSYGWDVWTIDGHSFQEIRTALHNAKQSQKPSLIIAKTVIGYGSPHLKGTSDVHGKAMGKEEVRLTKNALDIPVDPLFYVSQDDIQFFQDRQEACAWELQWQVQFDEWVRQHPEQALKWTERFSQSIPDTVKQQLMALDIKKDVATRQSSNAILQQLCQDVPFLVGGSADLSCSDSTMMKASDCVESGQFGGRNIKYGVREFAMGAMNTGLALSGGILPYCGTFLMFSDYMRNAIRLAALMNVHVIYQFTHDSVFLGEDGPTHQPVEHLASLRAIPNLTVIRPGDSTEVKGAWWVALTCQNPVALILSRQSCPDLDQTNSGGVEKGGYVLIQETGLSLDGCIFATGSELKLAKDVAQKLAEEGHSVRVVSMPSFELFEAQDETYQREVIGEPKWRVSIEAQSSLGWHRYIGHDGIAISVDQFGCSAPAADIAQALGFTVEQIVSRIHTRIMSLKPTR